MKLVKGRRLSVHPVRVPHFMDYELFTKTINQAAHNVHKRLRQVEYRTQGPGSPNSVGGG